jgi:hypothetical protein
MSRWWLALPTGILGYLVVALVHQQALLLLPWQGARLVAFTTVMSALAAVAAIGLSAVVARDMRCVMAVVVAGLILGIDAWQIATLPNSLASVHRQDALVPVAAQAVAAVAGAAIVCLRGRQQPANNLQN